MSPLNSPPPLPPSPVSSPPPRYAGKLKEFVNDLQSGKLHREFHHGPDVSSPSVHPTPSPYLPFPPLSPSLSLPSLPPSSPQLLHQHSLHNTSPLPTSELLQMTLQKAHFGSSDQTDLDTLSSGTNCDPRHWLGVTILLLVLSEQHMTVH